MHTFDSQFENLTDEETRTLRQVGDNAKANLSQTEFQYFQAVMETLNHPAVLGRMKTLEVEAEKRGLTDLQINKVLKRFHSMEIGVLDALEKIKAGREARQSKK